MKIIVIGFGNVGISYVYSLLNQKLNVDEIGIIDLDTTKTKGEILDINHGLPFIFSHTKVYITDYKSCSNADIIVITAGAKQKEGETRLDLLNKNAHLIKNITNEIVENNFKGIIINATNPLDVMTNIIYNTSGFDSKKIIGSGTSLDTARLKYNIGQALNVDYSKIQGYVIGEHGDSSVIAWSNTIVDNQLVINSLKKEQVKQIEENVVNAGYDLLISKGFSSQGVGMCLVDITKAIINDEQREITLSNYDRTNDVYYGYPVTIGKEGIIKRAKLNLSSSELELLAKSVVIIKKALEEID